MQNLSAVEPLYAPPELRPLAVKTLRAVGEARFASKMSLMAYAGPSGLVPDLLDTWTKAGLLQEGSVRLDPLSPIETPFVSLTPAGARELSNAWPMPKAGISKARLKRSGRKIAHDLCVGECVLAMLTLARDGSIDLLGVEADDKKLVTSATIPGPPPERVPLQPDALVMVKTEHGPSALLLEVDRGTISRPKMRDKFAGYLAWHAQDGPHRSYSTRALRVVTVVPNERRLNALHDAALEANWGRRSGFLLFMLQRDIAAYHAERLLGPVARPLGGSIEERVPLFADRHSSSTASSASRTYSRNESGETSLPATQSA